MQYPGEWWREARRDPGMFGECGAITGCFLDYLQDKLVGLCVTLSWTLLLHVFGTKCTDLPTDVSPI